MERRGRGSSIARDILGLRGVSRPHATPPPVILAIKKFGGKMAEPKTQVEQRLENIERAVSEMADWLVATPKGFNEKDAERIKSILYGRAAATPEDSAPTAE